MRHGPLSSRAVLALSTAALVAITSGATALVVLTGTATLLGLDGALDPRPPARAGDASAVVQLPGFRTPGAALISTLPGRGVVGFAPQLPGPVPAVPPRGVLFTVPFGPVPVSPVVLGPTGAVVALLTGAPVPTATVQSEKAAQRLAKEASTLPVPTTPTLALVQSRLVTASPAPVAVDARDHTAAATKSAGAKKSGAKKAAAKKAAAAKDSPRKQATTSGRTSVVKPAAGAAKKALAR